ncbi:uncharacterized protein STEHIDRAFT_65601 [Stereum hirsutum FP-91666 SS1]|uniref:uncharacterized protein n=1 Tax=Stereum hirsutum (strain FP-91666) TaxID=721885 RepID=UPI0004449202|nr:uncharacterized protein STEHIDRAFT_65601 [Stereum hirsutum FP-91666 SS1]EIM82175.1 hypothetical protein STEHIDRAFT_65601 [Stereum hirsutum FP-91666 SS1]
MRYIFLPPYSPDFNPIELAFSTIKAWIRRNGDVVRAAMSEEDNIGVYRYLMEAVWSITAEDAYGWFEHCGYF